LGRLFWKFFLLIALVQFVTLLAIGASFALRGPAGGPGTGPGAGHGAGPGGGPPCFDPGAPGCGGARPDRGPPDGFAPGGRPGQSYPPPPMAAGRAPDRPPGWRVLGIPPEPLVGGILASLASAALLAWYLSRPIRSLRDAIGAAAHGNLDVRVAGRVGPGAGELADLGRDFDRMVERLDALIKGQRRLLHDVSHELRSPLARIQAAIGLAHQQPDQSGAAMQRIERESMRMDKLIGELLAIARLQAGFTGAMDDDIDLNELMGAIVEDARFEAQSKGHPVEWKNLAGEVQVRGNVELLRRAIENVIRNAIKYSFEGRSVAIELRMAPQRESAVIAVRDSGPGVPEPDLEAVFEPFFRALAAGSHEGHGLGLAIAKRVVLAHGGRIRANNVPAGGLCVEIELPVAKA
jgi:signal transduction histidine kinase